LTQIIWHGSSLKEITSLAKDALLEVGHHIDKAKKHGATLEWRPIRSDIQGLRAIKVSDGDEQQLVYVAKISDKINVLGLSPETTPNTIVSACVWEALIADPVERRICHWKSNQVIRIKERIQELGLTIKEAAERMEISQVQMESLFRGRINEFTPEEMASMFFKLDIQVSGR
jgi:phage-related protein/predicted XRE-type DNA-binding protein